MAILELAVAGDAGEQTAQRMGALLDGAPGGVQYRIRPPVELFARGENISEVLHRLGMSRHRAQIALRQHPGHVLLRKCFHPHREAVQKQQVIGLRFRHDSATHGEDDSLLFLDEALETAPLDTAISRLPREQEDLREWHASLAFDLPIELNKRSAQIRSQLAAQGRLTRTAQPDERDPPAPNRKVLTELLGQSPERFSEPIRRQRVEETAQ